ncbi:ABC transporter ATP-binding protein [Streptomyces sp. A7024]|uniref:ABC transporter ATP-binding protein n=1 Tax=Streptomyces coryli TaxID=1128680 RepID=A0A6G4TSC4_9ACTN|nr:ABC transporter ATP-binding protein [Streptomyces coryli]NGN62450.1 ABC transporter ATP-binding protein [Streptomyces coryli]
MPDPKGPKSGGAPTLRDQARATALLITTAIRADPRRAVLVLLLAPAVGACTVGAALAIRMATDAAVRQDAGAALRAAALLLAAVAITHAAGTYVSRLRITLQQQVGLLLDQRLMTLTTGIPNLSHHEHPAHLDRMELLRNQRGLLGSAFGALVENLRAVCGLGAAIAVLASIHPAATALPLFALPAIAASRSGSRRMGEVDERTAEADRLRRSLFALACSPQAAAEIRVYRTAAELRRRHDHLQDEVDRARDRAQLRVTARLAAGWLVFGAGFLAAVLLAVRSVARGTGTPGDVVLTLMTGAQLLGTVSGVIGLAGWLQQAMRAAGYFLWLSDHATAQEQQQPPDRAVPLPTPRPGHDLTLHRLSFTYPGTDRPVLKDLSLRIPPGTTLALVGENGAGKTTLAKLLCRMYEPTSGTLRYAGRDLRSWPAATWRQALTACFQDFQRFEFTLRTAVGIGDLPRADDADAVSEGLARGGGADLPADLPHGLDTQLGPAFPGGTDLSAGQWQKVALSRALMRHDPALLVLDEPAAGLDPASEHALFTRYTQAARTSRTPPITVLISHRFTTVRMADLIAVLDAGTITELGTHEQLLSAGGRYANLYALGTRGYATTDTPQPR